MSPPYVVGDSSPFLKRVLIPFWVVRILVMLAHMVLYGVVIAGLGVFKKDAERLGAQYNTSLSYNVLLAVSCVVMAIILLCLILDIVCIVKRARRTLSPPFFLGVNITQSFFYIINFVLIMIGARNGALSIGIGVFVLLSFLGLLIYASVVYHQYRKGRLGSGSKSNGKYVSANNPEVHHLVENPGYPAQTAYPPPQQAYAPHEYPQTGYYDPSAIAGAQQQYGGQGYEPYRTAGHV